MTKIIKGAYRPEEYKAALENAEGAEVDVVFRMSGSPIRRRMVGIVTDVRYQACDVAGHNGTRQIYYRLMSLLKIRSMP